MRRVSAFVLVALCSVSAQDAKETQPSTSAQVEEIYVARSVPEALITPPTGFCAQERIGFGGTLFEARFRFQSTTTQASDGRMINANVKTIGSIHICTGAPTADQAIRDWYAEGTLGSTPFRGIGKCVVRAADFPERSLRTFSCFLDLSGLPSGYVGGLLTSNTMSWQKPGLETDPPGYTQASIATIRLWRKRDAPSSAMAQSKIATRADVSKGSLVGTWKLVSITDTTDRGEAKHWWGENPAGFLTYTADGRVSVIIARAGRKLFSTVPPPADELPEAFLYPAFLAYAGSYSFEGERVIHHIEACSVQNFVNTDQVRSAKLEGDRLTLRQGPGTVGGVQIAYTDYVWERMKPEATSK
ncbi:MAG TPA: lipocalin-like domain-containing protein [Candidatus Acidoferrales bacterium]|nr:lipocalin-like domain-containing protein [Candidatus Acidoferrales bacterium]